MDPHENNERLERLLTSVLELQQNAIVDDDQIFKACHTIINELVSIRVPKTAPHIKEYQNCVIRITQTMAIIIDRTTDAEQIFMNCLRILYEQMLTNGEACTFLLFMSSSLL